jgi:protein phosphatase
MSETVLNGQAEAPPELEELVEPLEGPAPEPLAAGTVLAAPNGRSIRVIAALSLGGRSSLYEVESDGEPGKLWLREAVGEAAGARLRQEGQLLQSLDSPMFPRVLDSFEIDGKTYLATEPVPGPTLAEAIGGGLPFSQLLSTLAQAAFALTRLHAQGWALLGLRPAGIALGKPIRLFDLSYATPLGEMPPAPFYHAGYSAPELLTEHPADARADVYSVGAMLFHAVNGRPIAETGAELSVWNPPAPVGGLPQILHRCLGSPESRYPTMQELHRDLLSLARRSAPAVSYSITSATTIGLEPTRTTNQDASAYLTGALHAEAGALPWAMLCVADGMGGMAAGEIASEAAVRAVQAEAAAAFAAGRALPSEEQVRIVQQWVHAANERVCAAMDDRQARGGRTLVCACLIGTRLTLAHVGDCRLYRLRGGEAALLTRDHSLVMARVLQGELPLEEVRRHPDRNQVARSLGDRQSLPEYYVDTLETTTGSPTMELQPGDVLLLCSDGLWEPVLEEEMLHAVHGPEGGPTPDLRAAADAMIALALQRGAPDNATIVLLRVEASGSDHRPPTTDQSNVRPPERPSA